MTEKVLVTGATGFLGRHVALTLNRLHYDVTATGRKVSVGENLSKQGIHFVRADLTHAKEIAKLCAGKKYVFHCGALSSAWGAYEDFYDSNVIGTENVIKGCQLHKVGRLIHVSTPSIYSNLKDQLNVTESIILPKKSVNAYAKTKLLAEQRIDRAFASGLPVITIRPRALFGPFDEAIVPRLLKANERGKIPFINRGRAFIDLTYVENIVDALIKCMSSPPNTLGEKYNISNGEPMTFSSLVHMLFSKLNERMNAKNIPYRLAFSAATLLEWKALLMHKHKEPLLTRSTVDMLGNSLTLDISKAKKDLGYEPLIRIEEGMDRYVTWFKGNQSVV